MNRLRFYGASDDLVEVDFVPESDDVVDSPFPDDFDGEISVEHATFRIESDGDDGKRAMMVGVRYTEDGMWAVSAWPTDEHTPIYAASLGVSPAHLNPGDGDYRAYSALLSVEIPDGASLTLVSHG